jgi:hypothetical protein
MSLRARLGRTKQSHRYPCSCPIHWAISSQIDFLHFALSLSKSPQYVIPVQAGIQTPPFLKGDIGGFYVGAGFKPALKTRRNRALTGRLESASGGLCPRPPSCNILLTAIL